jgi:predicted Zn-dependent protease
LVQVVLVRQMETQQLERLVAILHLFQQLLLVVAVAQANQRKLAVAVQVVVQATTIQH